MAKSQRLDLRSIRSIAKSLPHIEEIDFCHGKRIISFLNNISAVRINIYTETGTVGICRVLNSEVREIFRIGCSFQVVEEIFRNPPQLVSIDESMVNEELKGNRKSLEMLELGVAILKVEKEKLEEHLKVLKENEEEEHMKIYEDKGRNFSCSGIEETMTEVETYLETPDEVRCIATNGSGTVILYETGDWAFTEGIPSFLEKELMGRKAEMSPPIYVAIGSKNQSYISFEDGSFVWTGCEAMDVLMDNLEKQIHAIAFGADWDTFFVVYCDGSWEYNGTLPEELDEKLCARGEKGDLESVALGPDGEWFLASRNGRKWWGGVSVEAGEEINQLAARITFVDFGDDRSFILRYKG